MLRADLFTRPELTLTAGKDILKYIRQFKEKEIILELLFIKTKTMSNKKETLLIMIVKTLLAVIIFAGVGTIIISGAWLVENYDKVSNNNNLSKSVVKETKEAAPDNEIVEPINETKDEIANWQTYRNEEYEFEFEYPENWDYMVFGTINNSTIFAPQDVIIEIKQSIENIESDKTLTLMISIYDGLLFRRGILPYRGKSNEYIQETSLEIDIGKNKGMHYISEYVKDKSGYKVGEKTVTVDLAIENNYLSMHLFDYQYLDVFNQILSSFKFMEN